MHKKLLVTALLIISMIFACTFCFANDNSLMQDLNSAANSVQNAVGGAENAVEGAVKNAGNTVKDAGESAGNMAKNVVNEAGNMIHEAGNSISNGVNETSGAMRNTVNNSGYNATRTSTGNANTLMGMNATMWTWLIIGLAAIGIVALVWYYSMQFTNSHTDKKD